MRDRATRDCVLEDLEIHGFCIFVEFLVESSVRTRVFVEYEFEHHLGCRNLVSAVEVGEHLQHQVNRVDHVVICVLPSFGGGADEFRQHIRARTQCLGGRVIRQGVESYAAVPQPHVDALVALLTDDVRYRMPTRSLRYRAELAKEWSGEGEVAHFDDDKPHLTMRVNRLMSGVAWADEPGALTRHLIGNVRVRRVESSELEVDSAFLVHHSRGEHEARIYAGSRQDLLRTADGAFRIARRTIFLDAAVLPANLGVLL